MRRLVLPCLAILLVSLVVVASRGGDSSRPPQRAAVAVVTPDTDPVAQLGTTETLVAYSHALDVQRVGGYIAALIGADVVHFIEAREQAAATVAPISSPPVSAPASPPMSTYTGACGGATNGADQFIQRESGGNPQVFNPSGAYGCYQIMPGTWSGAGCDELGQYGNASPSAQAACASRLDLAAWNL